MASDLIRPGENGLLVDPSNPNVLSAQIEDAIKRFSSHPWDWDRIATEFMKLDPVGRYAHAFLEAIDIVQSTSTEP